jgi:hypothetical protein
VVETAINRSGKQGATPRSNAPLLFSYTPKSVESTAIREADEDSISLVLAYSRAANITANQIPLP